jgi:hypothetical protein
MVARQSPIPVDELAWPNGWLRGANDGDCYD